MSLLFFEGFEGGTAAYKPEWGSNFPSIVTIPLARTGYYGARTGGGVITLPSSAATLFMGIAVYPSGFTAEGICTFRSAAIDHVSVTLENSTGRIQIRRGGSGGTVVATSTYALILNVYRHIEIKVIINDTGGECIVRVDGSTVVSYTGDTNNGGVAGALNVDQITFVGSNNNVYFDDIWICDGVDATATQGRTNNNFLGDLKVSTLFPNGNGASSQFVGSDGNSTDNYLLVDEQPPNSSDYVGSGTPGQQDLYTLQDLPANTVSVYGLRVGAYAAKSDAGAAGLKLAIRESGGLVTLGPTAPLSTTWTGYYAASSYLKPSDSSLWTVSDVNSLQAGLESTS